MRACIVNVVATDRPEGFNQIASLLKQLDWTVDEVDVDPAHHVETDIARAEIASAFVHTPAPLVRSWHFAGLVHDATTGYDVVVISDRGGQGGVFALEVANRRSESSQQVWTIAGLSETLRLSRTGRSLATDDDALESVLDWEIVQYLASDRVVCRCEVERELLSDLGVESMVVQISRGRVPQVSEPSVRLFVPGEVSRENSSPEILRTISGLPGVSAIFGTEDRPDGYWEGTTWEAVSELRATLGDRVTRQAEAPVHADLVVIGDPFGTHEATMQWASDRSIPVAAPTGSVVASQWAGVAQWNSEDELALIVGGAHAIAIPGAATEDVSADLAIVEDRPVSVERARAISVGIPVFGDCVFLDDLLASVLAQSEQPHEVLLLVDGPPSHVLEATVEKWTTVFDGRLTYSVQPNRGVCVARNRLLELMSGDAVLLVDHDDVLAERALERMSAALRSNPRHSGVACWTEFFGDYEGVEAKPPFDQRVGMRENPIVSTSVLLDRAAIDGGVRFEPDLAFLYCEDWNFWAELVSRGQSLGLVPEPLVRHRVHRSSGGFKRAGRAFEVGRDRARQKLR